MDCPPGMMIAQFLRKQPLALIGAAIVVGYVTGIVVTGSFLDAWLWPPLFFAYALFIIFAVRQIVQSRRRSRQNAAGQGTDKTTE
jgi:MFS family permease